MIDVLKQTAEDGRTWAVSRWMAEVKDRPLRNIYRGVLDITWRQVIRHFGGDDVALCGPTHLDLVADLPPPPIAETRVASSPALTLAAEALRKARRDLADAFVPSERTMYIDAALAALTAEAARVPVDRARLAERLENEADWTTSGEEMRELFKAAQRLQAEMVDIDRFITPITEVDQTNPTGDRCLPAYRFSSGAWMMLRARILHVIEALPLSPPGTEPATQTACPEVARTPEPEERPRLFLPSSLEDSAETANVHDWNAEALETLATMLGVGNDYFYPLIGSAQLIRAAKSAPASPAREKAIDLVRKIVGAFTVEPGMASVHLPLADISALAAEALAALLSEGGTET